MRNRLKVFGASVRGPGHTRLGLPNQDAFCAFARGQVGGVVLSDGLGSCAKSDIGAKTICRVTMEEMRLAFHDGTFDAAEFVGFVKTEYFDAIDAALYAEFSATCLWAVIPGDGLVHFGMLGDGLVAVLTKSGEVRTLADDKADSFSNIVTSMSPAVGVEDWRLGSIDETEFAAAVLCSDGISDDLSDTAGFVKGFIGEFSSKRIPGPAIRKLLETWPVPHHVDDKTIVCMVRREGGSDERS